MKTYSYLIPVFLLLAGCNSGDNNADAFGNFEADARYLSSEINGKILRMEVDEGDQISSGSLIATIDTTQLYLRKNQLKATIKALKSKLQNVPVQLASLGERETNLRREIHRISSLLEDGAATQKQLDDLNGELHVVLSQLEATKSQLSTANQGILAEIEPLEWQIRQLDDQLAKSRITTPIDGTVLERFKEPGELALPGQPLIKLADLRQMTLRAFVSATQLGQLQLGQEVSVRVDSPDGKLKTYPARISWIASEAEFTPKVIQTKEERVNLVYAIKLDVANDGFLKIGMPGEVKF